jgi:hypothetical protein
MRKRELDMKKRTGHEKESWTWKRERDIQEIR